MYCAVVLDTYSRRVVGWSIDATRTSALVTNALSMAISNRAPDPQQGTIIHSDHGVQGLREGMRHQPTDGSPDWRLSLDKPGETPDAGGDPGAV